MSAIVGSDEPGGRSAPLASSLQHLLSMLVKLALAGEAAEAARWRTEAIDARRAVAGPLRTEPQATIAALWSRAVAAAERDPAVRRDETVNPTLPTTLPFSPDLLTAEPFDLDGAVQAIRDTASFG